MPQIYGYALSGVERCGAARSGYTSPKIFVAINGVQVANARPVAANKVLLASLTVSEILNQIPNTAAFTLMGTEPTEGQDVVITIGSINNLDRLFAGTILNRAHQYLETPATWQAPANVVDYTWHLTRRRFSGRFTTVAPAVVAAAIVATVPGFTLAVASGLPVLDAISFTDVDCLAALTQLAGRCGGYCDVDAHKVVKLFLTDPSVTNPTDLTAAHRSLTEFAFTRDLSQVRTRVYVEGYGSTARADALVGDTSLQVVDDSFYNPAGGQVVSGPQRITYTAIGSGNILTPTWITVTPPNITTPKWAGAAYAPTLRRFVIVGNAKVATSPDGLTWTEQTASWTGQAAAVVWAAALSRFVLVTNSGEVATSPDGITWTARTAAAANTWLGLTWAPELSGGLLVAVGQSGASRVMTSPDGITWTAQTAASALAWAAVSWSASLGILVAVAAQSGATSAMSSPDGITWTTRTPSDTGNAWFCVTWSPTVGKFVAGGSTGGIMYSSNGTTWTSIADRAGAANGINGVLWVPEESRYVAVIYLTTRLFWSTDAITWAEEVIPIGEWGLNGPSCFAYGTGTIIAVADDNGSNAILCANVSTHYALLTGIPASGTGSIQYAIAEGDDVNILVTVDDVAAQTALAALLGGGDDGVVEDSLQDHRISETEARARGTAQLALASRVLVSITYKTRDRNTHAGRTIHVNLGAPTNLTGDFQIQHVTWDRFDTALLPTATVQASSHLFSLDDLLRIARAA